MWSMKQPFDASIEPFLPRRANTVIALSITNLSTDYFDLASKALESWRGHFGGIQRPKMENKSANGFAVVVREEDTQEVLLKETFPEIDQAQERQRELQETADPEGIPTKVDIEPEAKEK